MPVVVGLPTLAATTATGSVRDAATASQAVVATDGAKYTLLVGRQHGVPHVLRQASKLHLDPRLSAGGKTHTGGAYGWWMLDGEMGGAY